MWERQLNSFFAGIICFKAYINQLCNFKRFPAVTISDATEFIIKRKNSEIKCNNLHNLLRALISRLGIKPTILYRPEHRLPGNPKNLFRLHNHQHQKQAQVEDQSKQKEHPGSAIAKHQRQVFLLQKPPVYQ